ncbi:MAG: hypothetical protein P8J68_09765 [Arenicellaceae bacterium]|nr:hypothetical protein [Arenicellaceae bacterium]
MFSRRVALTLTVVISVASPAINITAQELGQMDVVPESSVQYPTDAHRAQAESSQDSDLEVTVNNVIENDGNSNILDSRNVYDLSRNNLAAVLFPDAEAALLESLKNVPTDTALKENIESSLYLDLTIGEVNQLVASVRVEGARALLGKAILIAKSYPSHEEQL